MCDNVVSAFRRRRGAIPAVLMSLGLAACEDPQPPAPCGPAPQVTVNARESTAVTACFDDPNGDVLSYSATSSNTSVATASVSGANITVAAVLPGDAAVTVTATDPDGLQGQQIFQVMVPNRAPEPMNTMPPMTVVAGQVGTVDAAAYFTEPDGQPLSYSALSPDDQMVTVTTAGSTVTVAAIAKGTATVSVTASDPAGLTAQQAFQVTVPNRAPVAVGSMADIEVYMDTVADVDVAEYFDDPDGDSLTYTASSSSPAHASVSVTGSVVTVNGLSEGTARVTVTARDSEGLSAAQTFSVKVTNPDRAVLVAVYDALDGSNWTNKTNWLSAMALDTWYGVITGDDSRVTHLELPDNDLDNSIPPEIGRLRKLVRLDLSDNWGIEGRIPRQLGDLENLEWLDLSGSYFWARGAIPVELGNLKKLKWLDLSDTWFWPLEGGPIPREFGNLESLERLDLRDADVHGRIPSQLGNLEHLTWLDLSRNSLTGELPRSFIKLELDRFHWGDNEDLCAPADQEFQDWLKGIEDHEGGKTCE